MPEPEVMDAETGVTLEDWEGIPTHELPEVCAEARRRCKGFLPPNSLPVEIWAEEQHRRFRVQQNAELYAPREQPVFPERTPEEKAELQKFFDGLKASL